jgi:hypothetical protein
MLLASGDHCQTLKMDRLRLRDSTSPPGLLTLTLSPKSKLMSAAIRNSGIRYDGRSRDRNLSGRLYSGRGAIPNTRCVLLRGQSAPVRSGRELRSWWCRWQGKRKLACARRLNLRVCTYFFNIVLFRKYLIASRPRPRLQALKRKRAFAEQTKSGGKYHETRSIAHRRSCSCNSGCLIFCSIQRSGRSGQCSGHTN